jgi:cytosine/uracil/thiamine/allantoin permease
MEKRKKIIIISSVIVFLAVVGISIWLASQTKTPVPSKITVPITDQDAPTDTPSSTPVTSSDGVQVGAATHSDNEINQYIAKNNSSLVDSSTGLPVYTVVSTKQPIPGWYVVKIRHNTIDTSDASIVIEDINGTLTKIAGPGTGLFNRADLPKEVKKALSDD